MSWWPEKDGRGFWAVTRYQDLLTVNLNPRLFSSARGIRLEDMSEEELEARRTMMELDPPQHAHYRRMVGQPFSPREVLAYEEGIRLLAREVIAEVRGKREFDFVIDIARRLPMRMLGKLLGIPDAEGMWMVKMGDALIGARLRQSTAEGGVKSASGKKERADGAAFEKFLSDLIALFMRSKA